MFAVGDKVLCVDAKGMENQLEAGSFYVVSSFAGLDMYVAPEKRPLHRIYAFSSRFLAAPSCDAVVSEDCVCATVPPPAPYEVGDMVRYLNEPEYAYEVVELSSYDAPHVRIQKDGGSLLWVSVSELERVPPPPEHAAFRAVAAERDVPAGWRRQAPDSEGWVEYISDTGLVVTKTPDGFFAAHLGQGGVRRDTFEEAATDAVDDALADTGCPTPGSCVDCNPPPVVNPKTSQGAAKPNLALVLDTACLQEAVAMMSGAEKYGAFNWRESTVPAMTYVAAMRRHLALWLNGEDGETDPKTGYYVTHLGAVRANAAILIDAQSVGTLVDDRPPPTLALRYAMTRNLKEAP